MVETTRDRQTETNHVHRALLAAYGEPTWRPHLDPVSELVSTILSQNTNDVNRDVAYDRLRDRLPTWELVRDADVEDVVDAIRPAGLANQKGPRIQEALRFVTRERIMSTAICTSRTSMSCATRADCGWPSMATILPRTSNDS